MHESLTNRFVDFTASYFVNAKNRGEKPRIVINNDKSIKLNGQTYGYIQGFDLKNVEKFTDPSILKRLTETVEVFQKLTEENCSRLLGKVEATKRVFAVIQKAVHDNGSTAKTYGNSGSVKSSIGQAFTPVLSVGVNDEI